MFTGIVETTGEIKEITGNKFTILYYNITDPLDIGESIALSGMCATVIQKEEDSFTVEIMEESRNKTIFGAAKVGDKINLERAARIEERNSGHVVSGHIDGTGEILDINKQGDYWKFRISLGKDKAKFIVEKGSIAMDGISLTVSKIGEGWFEVCVISHTWKVTNLSEKKVGDFVNLEFDILGKYILRAHELS